ncbi:hypothetical protein Taro_030742 [Colocasia esculenta]|uniref:AP2/ERF domain-containing protein n=1 Tax=Colocasia esculenta TaxID=4460 RepID=A0A843VUV6_COLES|nr:hypothetical protein [Colocasia esculenta]
MAGKEGGDRRYKGVRRRSWGKWVTEVRVPGTRERLWLGSYSTPEAAAVAYDTAVFYLKGPSSAGGLNFPGRLSPAAWAGLSPRSIQQVACDMGMALDAELVSLMPSEDDAEAVARREQEYSASIMHVRGDALDISVDDMEIYL